jgi:hypothetical protein
MSAQNSPSVTTDDTDEAHFILDDIHDLDAIAQAEREYEARLRKNFLNDRGSQFPDLVLEEAPSWWRSKTSPRVRQNHSDGTWTSSSGSLLGQLRDQAQAVREQQVACERLHLHRAEQLDRSLRQVFAYLHDLAQQLNVLQPEIPRVYSLVEDKSLQGLRWRQGYTDYRASSTSERAFMERVSLDYHLVSPDEGPILLERDGSVARTFRQRLFDFNLNMRVEEKRDERNLLESIRFHIAREVKVSVRWEPDHQEGALRVSTRNLERLGYLTYRLPTDAPMNLAVLEEFGRMVLGQPHRFPHIARRPSS